MYGVNYFPISVSTPYRRVKVDIVIRCWWRCLL
jgi:hypothetical protein